MTARLPLDELWTPDTPGSDEWYTPPHIFQALDVVFNYDVAAPPGGVPWVPAKIHLDSAADGLAHRWYGSVWCNPPYSDPAPWLERMANHRCGIALVSADTSARWWHRYATTADAMCFLLGRLNFVTGNDVKTTSARTPSVLLAWDHEYAAAVLDSDLGWTVDQRRPA